MIFVTSVCWSVWHIRLPLLSFVFDVENVTVQPQGLCVVAWQDAFLDMVGRNAETALEVHSGPFFLKGVTVYELYPKNPTEGHLPLPPEEVATILTGTKGVGVGWGGCWYCSCAQVVNVPDGTIGPRLFGIRRVC